MSGLPVPEWDWYPAPDLPNVTFGEGCWLETAYALANVRTRRPCGLRVGERTGLYAGTFLDLGPEAELHIGSYCTIVGALFSSNSRIRVGDYCFLSSEVLVADRFDAVPPTCPDAQVYAERMPPLTRPTTLGDDVWIGPRVAILGGVSIGHGAAVGAGAVVLEDVPPESIAVGNPARVVGTTRG